MILYSRSRRGWNVEEIFETKIGERKKSFELGRKYEFNGEIHSLRKWSEMTGMYYYTLKDRIERGWSIEKALTTPKMENRHG